MGFSQKGADGIVRHYTNSGVVCGTSQKGADGIIRHRDNRGNVKSFTQNNSHYDNRGNKIKSPRW